jgi:hypothetical protein
MPLERYTHGAPHHDAATEGAIRFPMTNGQRVIACEIDADVLRQLFGAGGDPLDVFLEHRAAIEAAASRAYDRGTFPNDLMELTASDFDASA